MREAVQRALGLHAETRGKKGKGKKGKPGINHVFDAGKRGRGGKGERVGHGSSALDLSSGS